MERIPAEILDRPVAGLNLTAGPLREQIGARPTVLAFLRHLG